MQIGSAHWELSAYGYGTDLGAVLPVAPQAEANRVEYRRGPLTEWYVNGPLGVQQGFTLTSPPGAGSGNPLTLALALRGDLKAEVDRAGDGLTLRRADGAAAVRYRGLSAYDAAGRKLRAWLEITPITIRGGGDRGEVTVLVRLPMRAPSSLPNRHHRTPRGDFLQIAR